MSSEHADPVLMTPLPLRRGGMVVVTSDGPIQFGCPPETIKDSIGTPHSVAHTFVLTRTFFDYDRGIAFAEVEFPIYWNFFIQRQKARLVCTAEQAERVRKVMQESLFGPEHIDIRDELPSGPEAFDWMPDLRKELAWFRKNPFTGEALTLDQLVEFVLFDPLTGTAVIEGVTIVSQPDGTYSVTDGETGAVATIPASLSVPLAQFTPKENSWRFEPPVLGATILGSGHGFDPNGRTTGFVLWTNGRGILVDPPVDATLWMQENDVPPLSVDAVILTHCHADHDGGLLQRALLADRVRLFTTQTIFDSFLRKAVAFTGLPAERFTAIINFVPVKVGETVAINGARFVFHYTFHSIPTIGFQVWLGGRSVAYSADTFYDPETITRLREENVMSEGRAAKLVDFPWDHDLVIHEAGIPPIHTSTAVLKQLPDDIKERLYLVHTTAGAIPADSGLKLAPMGLEGTIVLEASDHPRRYAIDIVRAFQAVEHFRDMSMDKVIEFLENVEVREFEAGEAVISTGDEGLHFYIIMRGKCAILRDESLLKVIGMYEWFGEASLLLDAPRSADVVAVTNCTMLALGKTDFMALIAGTPTEERMIRLYSNRERATWQLMDANSVMLSMNSAQRTQIQSLMIEERYEDGQRVCQRGEAAMALLVESGTLLESNDTGASLNHGRGEFVGHVDAIVDGEQQPTDVIAVGSSVIYRLDNAEFATFLRRYPGVYLRLLHDGGKRALASALASKLARGGD